MAKTDRPIAAIGSGIPLVASIVNELVDAAKNHPASAEPIELIVINTKEPQPKGDVAYPMQGIKADDMHPFKGTRPPAGFPTFGEYIREMAKEDPSLKSALRTPTYGQVAAYMDFVMELAIIAAGDKVAMKPNRKGINDIVQKTWNGPAYINYKDGTELAVTPAYAEYGPHMGGPKDAAPPAAAVASTKRGKAKDDFGAAAAKTAKRGGPKPKHAANEP